MSEKRSFILAHAEARRRAMAAVAEAPEGYSVTVAEPNRSLEQNAAQWPLLQAFSEQLQWPVNGQLVTLSAAEWKDVLSAAFQRETARLAMGLDGGVVMLGLRTSKLGKRRFSEWLDFLNAVAAQRGIELEPVEATS
jgi:hypothetical protein